MQRAAGPWWFFPAHAGCHMNRPISQYIPAPLQKFEPHSPQNGTYTLMDKHLGLSRTAAQ
jgi:hypothetical protein